MATPRTCMVRSGRAAAYSSSHRRRGLPRGCFRFIVSMARLTKKKGCYAHCSPGRSLRQTTPRDLACCCSPAATLMGARQALTYFDEIANPERMIGRLALFDLLVHLGDTQTA